MDILVVDDDQTNLMLAKAILMRLGYEAQFAASGEEALELYSRQPVFDIVLMDINMPGMNGYKASQLLREKGCKAKIIALTANDGDEIELRSEQSGMDGFLLKPINIKSLAKILADAPR